MLASASIGDGPGLYEPSHGSAPKYTGMDIVNPTATIMSGAMMLKYSFALEEEATAIDSAIEDVLAEGWRTKDIAHADTPLERRVGTSAMGDLVAAHIC